MNAEAYCKCCSGTGIVAGVKYVWVFGQELKTINIDYEKSCPGCQGNKISKRAKEWRKSNSYEEI